MFFGIIFATLLHKLLIMKPLKFYSYLFIIAFLIISCGSYQTKNNQIKEQPVVIANDSLEYQITIIDPGFTTYLSSTAKPINFYEQSYLENKNKVFVRTWNSRVQNPTRYSADIYGMTINYDPKINYGLEVNYKLFWYFRFAEKKYRTRLD